MNEAIKVLRERHAQLKSRIDNNQLDSQINGHHNDLVILERADIESRMHEIGMVIDVLSIRNLQAALAQA